MSEVNDPHVAQFEQEVQDVLTDLLQMDIPDWISPHRGAPELYHDVQAHGAWEYVAPHLAKLKWFSREYKNQSDFEHQFKNNIEANALCAVGLLNRKTVRERICPVLTKGSNDFFDIAKCITPVLVGAEIAGSLTIPLNPLIVALAALMIARVGIHAFCKDRIEIGK